MRQFDEVGTALGALDAKLKSLTSSVNTKERFAHGGHADLDALAVVAHAIDLSVDRAKTSGREAVGFFGHAPYSAAMPKSRIGSL